MPPLIARLLRLAAASLMAALAAGAFVQAQEPAPTRPAPVALASVQAPAGTAAPARIQAPAQPPTEAPAQSSPDASAQPSPAAPAQPSTNAPAQPATEGQQPAESAPPAPGEHTEPTRPPFSEWLAALRTEAVARGIRPATVDAALATVQEPEPTVVERDRSQAETVLTLDAYIARQLKPRTIRLAREMFTRNQALLEQIGDRYGVPPRLIVGVWGVESHFGQFVGVRPTIQALATLAWDPRRSALFREELLDALAILDRGDIDVARMRGSWAGAMGQPQFMPSSYLRWAEDFDGDGRADIWSTPADVFASIANFLKGHGWKAGERWGREVALSPAVRRRIANDVAGRNGSCQARRDMTVRLPIAAWQRLGVRLPNGRALPKSSRTASLVTGAKRAFLVYDNYDALLEYNCAHAYAIAVALLGDSIPPARRAPREQTARRDHVDPVVPR